MARLPCAECRLKTSSEDERRKFETRQSLDSVTASILTTGADLHNSIDDELMARTVLMDKEQRTVEIRSRLAALETRHH